MKFHVAAVNQWDEKQWPFPTKTLFALNFEGMPICPGCGHTELQLQCLLFGFGLVFVVKWNPPTEKEKKDLELSHNHA